MKKIFALLVLALLAVSAQAQVNATLECLNIGPAQVQGPKGEAVETSAVEINLEAENGSQVTLIATTDAGFKRGQSYVVTVTDKADSSASLSLPVSSLEGPARKVRGEKGKPTTKTWTENFKGKVDKGDKEAVRRASFPGQASPIYEFNKTYFLNVKDAK